MLFTIKLTTKYGCDYTVKVIVIDKKGIHGNFKISSDSWLPGLFLWDDILKWEKI